MPDVARGPRVFVPPPFVFVGGWLVAWLCQRQVGFEVDAAGPGRVQVSVGTVLLVAGLGLMGWAMVTFLRARTPVVPIRPARVLVTSGPFAFSRNPMYVGLTTAYLGLAGVFNQAWPIVWLPVVLVVLSATVIAREEAHLRIVFGTTYEIYSSHVRRWF